MKLGVIAGNRLFPILACRSAKRKNKNIELVAICFYGETNPRITHYVDKTFWLHVGQLKRLIEIIKTEGFSSMVMAGQISPRRIFKRKYWDEEMKSFISNTNDFRSHSIFSHIIRMLETSGVKFESCTFYMEDSLAQNGIINNLNPTFQSWQDINFGVRIISKFVELDVGQSIVVKSKSVIALEGLEGTDRTILRAYRIAGSGLVVFKFSKKDQDLRFDVPVVGLNTLRILKRVGATCLVLEQQRVIILEKNKFLLAARHYGIPVIGQKRIN